VSGERCNGAWADPEKLRQMRELRERNLPFRTIAHLTGIARSTVGDILKGQGETVYDLRCEQCEREMVAFKATKRFCSSLCRQRSKYGRNDSATYRKAA
jgi:hypothetical protein